jgi:heat shock protein HtpX
MWEAISSNKRKSFFLIAIMGILLLTLGGTIGAAIFGAKSPEPILLGVFIAAFIWFIMTIIALSQGKKILLAFSGAREVKHEDAPQLYNIVEEMRIAASLPATPKVFIMEEKAPNAFACGTPNNAAVAVTTGLLSILSRDELQGVIAHEIGHIKNQDTNFMTIAGVMMGTIVILADIFVRTMFYGQMFGGSRRRSSNQGGGQLQMIIMVVAIIFAILAPILAHLLYMACSRSREYLADASAAIFTRYPEGLASALEKISGAHIPLPSANRVTAPMYIVKPLMKAKGEGSSAASSLGSTHPPIKERVAILRNMGTAGLGSYNEAYKTVKGGEGVIGAATLRSAEELEMRGIAAPKQQEVDTKKQTRAANDILHKLNNFLFLPCACGVNLKIPPTFTKEIIKCPKCGQHHNISEAKARS